MEVSEDQENLCGRDMCHPACAYSLLPAEPSSDLWPALAMELGIGVAFSLQGARPSDTVEPGKYLPCPLLSVSPSEGSRYENARR
jgi:hypothetical protein